MMRPALVAASAALLLATSQALAQESWVGKEILTTRDAIKLRDTPNKSKPVYVGELNRLPLSQACLAQYHIIYCSDLARSALLRLRSYASGSDLARSAQR
jgi:hypothetical protein